MALAASPPAELFQTNAQEQLSDSLDEEIKALRAQIQSLTTRRNILASTVLNSTAFQSQLKPDLNDRNTTTDTTHEIPSNLQSLLHLASTHTQSNIHRIVFGVTAFPFTDPNPSATDDHLPNPDLLGIRFDLLAPDGTYKDPHYVLCRRVGRSNSKLTVHKHTIPSFVPIKEYEAAYLPSPDDDEDGDVDQMEDAGDQLGEKQDLHGFVQKLRQDLVSWNLRSEAVETVAEQLGLREIKREDVEAPLDPRSMTQKNSFGVRKLDPIGADVRYVGTHWDDGRVGRIKISDDGFLERAIVFGEVAGSHSRLRNAERILTEDGRTVQILDLVKRLEKLEGQ